MPGGWAWAWALKTTFRRLWVSATESLAPVTDAELAAMCDGQLIKLVVVGLGNYGSLASRHSVGMAAVRHIAAARGGSWKSARREWKANVCLLPEVGLALVEPRLFMNDNGRSVARALKMLKLSPSELVLLHDDLDAALGKVRIKEGGSASGHKGVQSTIQHVNTQVSASMMASKPASLAPSQNKCSLLTTPKNNNCRNFGAYGLESAGLRTAPTCLLSCWRTSCPTRPGKSKSKCSTKWRTS